MMKKKLFKIVFALIFCFGLSKFCAKQTGGFSIMRISQNFSPTSSLSSNPETHLSYLDQSFTYFDKGKQSFVFLSEDGQFILKFFNNNYRKKIRYYSWLEQIPFLKAWAKERKLYFIEKLERTFQSYSLAEEILKDETALIYVHLEPTSSLKTNVHIVDKIGIHHTIRADEYAFLIQKKADLVYPTLSTLKKTGQKEKAQALIHSLIELLKNKYQKGIADNDSLVRTNIGFLEGRAVQIDVGPFSLDPAMQDPTIYVPEILKTTRHLKKWLSQNYPDLLPFLDAELAAMVE